MITRDADQEPMLQVKTEGKPISLLLDTGATFLCLNPTYASHLPMSGKYMKTVGFSGVTQLLPMTAPHSLNRREQTFVCIHLPSIPLTEESRHLFAFTYQAPDGSFTRAMEKLKNLRDEVTENAGTDMKPWHCSGEACLVFQFDHKVAAREFNFPRVASGGTRLVCQRDQTVAPSWLVQLLLRLRAALSHTIAVFSNVRNRIMT
ncbi:hypothetical protein QQF64_033768 [Cirrhinus molitorella]|uniref:Retropepsins domain-containing protein n=1 Tax=Cirrhinus molitorella TaxID=172907 RepID=A0ABR3MV47_9TELE